MFFSLLHYFIYWSTIASWTDVLELFVSQCMGDQYTFDLKLWPINLDINRNQLITKDYLFIKFDASDTKHYWVIRFARCERPTVPLTLKWWPHDLKITWDQYHIKDYLPTLRLILIFTILFYSILQVFYSILYSYYVSYLARYFPTCPFLQSLPWCSLFYPILLTIVYYSIMFSILSIRSCKIPNC